MRAPVTPRAYAPECGEPLPLEDLVAPYLDAGEPVTVTGPMGSGKTTAIAHLKVRWPDAVLDEDAEVTFELAPWGPDEWIEYLLAVHPERCGSVMARLGAVDSGVPEIWTAVLDAMAADATLPDEATALRAHFADDARLAGTIALRGFDAPKEWRLLRHARVKFALAGAEIVRRLHARRGLGFLRRVPPADVVAAAGAGLDVACVNALKDHSGLRKRQPTVASLLHAAGVAWQPPERPDLSHALLAGIAWKGVDLTHAELCDADLAGADLTEANLDWARANDACLRRARLHAASLVGFQAQCADLTEADLGGARLERADLKNARLVRADLTGANLDGARLIDTDLENADLTAACLDGTWLRGLDLRRTALDGASFAGAYLAHANLANARMQAAWMPAAVLLGADLTGAHMPDARLVGAVLREARLANVCWERADLRNADLRGCNFHLGSSRSGLVESFLASEGTRTGFYTDDFDEQHFKSPEEIRKANLRGADLRGAKAEDTDFYLVDLRDARYDEAQEQHFKRCGAILRSRV